MENHFENIKSLIENTKSKIGKPVSCQVVHATIESLGIREKDTLIDFGFASISDLADLVYYELMTNIEYRGAKNDKEKEVDSSQPKTIQISDYLWIKTRIFAEYYSLGIFHLLPVLIQIAAIILFGYSLWTFIGFNEIQSTAVVLGVIIGMIASGGFVQVIGRQASFYWNYEDFQMTNKTINFFHKIGIASILILFALIFLLNFIFHIYPYQILFVIFVYAFLIGTLLMLLAPLHTLKQRWIITLAIFSGTVIAVFLKEKTLVQVYFTHWIGIATAIIISKVFLKIYFNKISTKKESSHKLNLPVILYHNYQYFFYGILIYVFIFIDRILAWSSGINGPLPFIIYFDKDYELGMDLAILIYLLLAGVLEYSIASFTRFIDIGQKNTAHKTPEVFNNHLEKMYWQQVVLLFITAIVAFVFIYYIITASWGFERQFNEVLLQLSIKVCLIGGLGYLLLAWGMLNSVYLFTLGRAREPLRALFYACILNLLVGFSLSRFIGYEYSVVGMLSGAILFVSLTLKANISFLKNLDYYYYAAY